MKLKLPVIRRILALVLLTAISPFASAHQQTATISFSSPSLSGSFGVKLEPTTQALVAITSVSLTIDGYKFKLKDVGFRYDEVNDITFIAGLANGMIRKIVCNQQLGSLALALHRSRLNRRA